ncbi:MAG: hypothetical protein HUK14_08625 [Muribaculaceae bacterium]|nr:hypothetical protein [Muribaculaceae bacterium]
MKKIIGIFVIAALALTSCQSSSELAKTLTGSWTVSPQHLFNNINGDATLTQSYTFEAPKAQGEGTVTVTAAISIARILQPTNMSDSIQPITLTGTGSATISGTWRAKDGDEVDIYFDLQTLSLEVDPQGLTTTTNMNDESANSDQTTLAPLNAQEVASFHEQMLTALKTYYSSDEVELDDITFVDYKAVFRCKQNHQKVKFVRQQ